MNISSEIALKIPMLTFFHHLDDNIYSALKQTSGGNVNCPGYSRLMI
jgi:hypothetical protein